MDPVAPWLEALKDFICKLYEAWGGDCDDLGASPSGWIDTIESEYNQNGLPDFPNDHARQSFSNNVNQLKTHLANSGNSLSQADNTRLSNLIDSLQADLQGQGA